MYLIKHTILFHHLFIVF
uniref:Uncharacterized protein n=1 Tax=Lepeophtheirus salmonis TaxID=72036 RepID=A0A0K2UQE4_LEPSM